MDGALNVLVGHMALTSQWAMSLLMPTCQRHNGDEMKQTGANHFYCSLCVSARYIKQGPKLSFDVDNAS